MDQYAKATMSEREFLAYEVRHLGLAEHHAQSLLSWRQAILDVTEKQAAAEKRQQFDTTLGGTLEGIRNRIAELRGELDALARDEKRATEPLVEAFAAGTIDFSEFRERVAELQGLFADLRAAQGEAEARQKGEALTEAMRTPEERARDEVGEYQRLLDAGAITTDTYNRAVRTALEDAVAAMPDAVRRTVGVRGTFNALEAGGLGAGGVSDRIARATEETAKNTEKIAALAAGLGVTFN
jgi:chromosome segregation ATPase